MKYDIFISYRRDGGDTLAQLIYDRLTDRGYSVFLDIESLRSGKFNEKLFSVIDECGDVVVILPPGALERCRNEGDWLYLELTHAMKERKNIIPVMMKGFEWPEELPEGLEELRQFNGIQDSKDYFDAVIDKMTSLLHSRPVLFGAVRKKLHKKRPHINIREKARRGKKLLIAAAALLLAGVLAFTVPRAYREHQLREMAENVDIMLYPGEEMSASAYYDAQEILKQRFDILAKGEEYEFTVDNDRIHVLIPQKVFRGVAPDEVLTSYVGCAAELSVVGYTGGDTDSLSAKADQRVDLDREDIVSLERKTDSGETIGIDRIDKESYGLEEADEYEYFEITFSEEAAGRIREMYGEHEIYYLGQDVESAENLLCFFQMLASDSPNTFYIVDNYQEETFGDLMEFNYQHEPFEGRIEANCIPPVEWECISRTENPGEKQCDIWDMEQPYITLELYAGSEEIAPGELQDYMSNLKQRLDTLDIPYAIGKAADSDSENSLVVRTQPERMGMENVRLLFSSYGLKVEGMYYDLINSYDIKGIEYEEKSDGTYQFSLVLGDDTSYDWWQEDYNTAVKEISSSENSEIYLIYDFSYRIAKADINESVDGMRIIFDNLYYLGLDSIEKEDVYLLDFLKEVAETPKMSAGGTSYALKNYRIDGADKSAEEPTVTEKLLEKTEESIHSSYPEAEVSCYADTLQVKLNIETGDQFPENVNKAIQKIYSTCGLTSGEWENASIIISDKTGGEVYISIESDNTSHCMGYNGYYSGDALSPYREEFEQILRTDPFYTQTIKEKYEDAWTFY